MTSKKQLKARIRARMAKTGERYTTARRYVAGSTDANPTETGTGAQPQQHYGYALRGGVHPESATVANLLAHHGCAVPATGEPLSEALVFGIGGGLGAGYILWEFAKHNLKHLILGYRNSWQSISRLTQTALERLDVPFETHATGGAKGAATRLTELLASGRASIVWPERHLAGYWHVPQYLEGYGAHAVVAYAERDGRVYLDDRNIAPLSVERGAFDAARARVGSYKNLIIAPAPRPGPLDPDSVRAAVRAGIADCATHLSARSESFSLPTWRKWARLMTDPRNAKGWPTVFADRRGLVGALLSVWEGVEPAGMTGGNLRALYADFLDEAGALLDTTALAGAATAFRDAAAGWHAVAETALPDSVPEFAAIRDLTAALQESIAAEGNEGQAEAASAAAQLWTLRATYDAEPPLDAAAVGELFAAMGKQLAEIHGIETAAIDELRAVVAGWA
jgi:hypothetical protein